MPDQETGHQTLEGVHELPLATLPTVLDIARIYAAMLSWGWSRDSIHR